MVAHNIYGDTLSDCIEVEVAIPPVKEKKEPEIPGYEMFFLIVVISIVIIFIGKKWHNQIIKN